MPCRKAALPAKNAMNEAASPNASATAPNTAALAASSSGRRGAAASVDLIIPDEYSLVISSAPRTPLNSRAGRIPASALFVRSSVPLVVFRPTATPMATAPTALRASVNQVERRLRSLIHSIRATCRNP